MSLNMFLAAGLLAASLYAASNGATAADTAAAANTTAAANAAPATETTIQVSAKNFMFTPASVTVKAGTIVTWVNLDDEPHTVFSDAGLFRSSALDTQERFSFKFEKAGTYHYLCTIHPRMLGTVVVE
jgi:plastocyanin